MPCSKYKFKKSRNFWLSEIKANSWKEALKTGRTRERGYGNIVSTARRKGKGVYNLYGGSKY